MTDEKADQFARVVSEHGDQLANNLVYFKKFAAAQNERQETFLRELQSENDKLQRQSVRAARWAAVAAVAAAVAAIVQLALAAS